MVDNSLILVNFDPDVGVRLSRNSPRLDKASGILIHVIASLGCRNVMCPIRVQTFLPPTHRLVVEFPTLFLKLVITNIECVPPKTVIAHSNLIGLSVQMVEHLVVILVIIVYCSSSLRRSRLRNIKTIVSVVVTVAIRRVVLVGVYLILLRLPAPPVVVEHAARLLRGPRGLLLPHLDLPRVLEGQVLLSRARVAGDGGGDATAYLVLVVDLLLVVVLVRLGAVGRVLE